MKIYIQENAYNFPQPNKTDSTETSVINELCIRM